MSIILHSQENGFLDKEGFFEFSKPIYKVEFTNNLLFINSRKVSTNRPLKLLEKLILKKKLYGIGYISYEFKDYIFGKSSYKKDPELNLPTLYFELYKGFERLDRPISPPYKNRVDKITYPNKNRYIESVKKALRYIQQGDIYQINLSHRIKVEGFFNVYRIFQKTVAYQPAPFQLLLKTKNFSIISNSMELFLKKENNKLTTKPIKGTRPRGKTKKEDEKLRNQLKNSPKERAENLMITDLMRNDLGRIAKPASIKVSELFKVEKYSTLFQMHSTVEASVSSNISFEDIIYNTFPPGSITGAPKKRAIEIIDELEEQKRHVYCGAWFFIKPNLDFVSSVAIRQSIFQKNRCFIYVGAGIVADSDPELEYEETILKAKANLIPLFE